MIEQVITAAAGVLGAGIGAGGALLGASMDGRRQRANTRISTEREACSLFLARLDIYRVVVDELVWAKKEAQRLDGDIDSATADLRERYRAAWLDLLTANAAAQLVTSEQFADLAQKAIWCCEALDRNKWNYVDHQGRQIAGEYKNNLAELDDLRGELRTTGRGKPPHQRKRLESRQTGNLASEG
ncbi:hypothetical protein [Micromonospora sp. WMMD980]|uniref:hypothetical protein n=1 Tax=Micromonospora sp. WMMD980 TaxID=3016088 RepID=UPI0024175EEB|nr:hypothetical protein [Micromonospora sp. WMMD980]MDG4799332.1 hypothetical protein [Micromonospora sp. WMMD980]